MPDIQVQHVPVHGGSIPAVPASTPQVPANDGGDGGGFPAVPPAGKPPRMPGGTGEPIVSPGQVPGYIVNPPQIPGQPQPQAQAPADNTAAIAALLAQVAALQAPQAQQPTAQAPAAATPDWLPNANTFDVASIDDPIIKSAATALQLVGKDLDLNRVLGNALVHGNSALIDVAYLAEKGGPQAQQLASLAKSIVDAVVAKSEAVTGEVYSMAGGEAQWNAAMAAFNKGASPELKQVAKMLLDSTDSNKIKMGAKFILDQAKVGGFVPQQGAPLLTNIAAGAPYAAQGLSKVQFQTEHAKLDKSSPSYEAEYNALAARRALGKRSGL